MHILTPRPLNKQHNWEEPKTSTCFGFYKTFGNSLKFDVWSREHGTSLVPIVPPLPKRDLGRPSWQCKRIKDNQSDRFETELEKVHEDFSSRPSIKVSFCLFSKHVKCVYSLLVVLFEAQFLQPFQIAVKTVTTTSLSLFSELGNLLLDKTSWWHLTYFNSPFLEPGILQKLFPNTTRIIHMTAIIITLLEALGSPWWKVSFMWNRRSLERMMLAFIPRQYWYIGHVEAITCDIKRFKYFSTPIWAWGQEAKLRERHHT